MQRFGRAPTRLVVALALACVAMIGAAQVQQPIKDAKEQNLWFPGANTPSAQWIAQNAGGASRFGADKGEDFENQPGVNVNTDMFATTGWTSGLTGGYKNQLKNKGIDPVFARDQYAAIRTGRSSSSVTGRSGRGAASGHGYFVAETRFPHRVDYRTNERIPTHFSQPSAPSVSAASSVAPSSLVVVVVAACVLLFQLFV